MISKVAAPRLGRGMRHVRALLIAGALGILFPACGKSTGKSDCNIPKNDAVAIALLTVAREEECRLSIGSRDRMRIDLLRLKDSGLSKAIEAGVEEALKWHMFQLPTNYMAPQGGAVGVMTGIDGCTESQ
jgi:hypothetical protein